QHFLTATGHQVNIVVPSDYPDFLSWLPGANDIVVFDDETETARHLIDRASMFFILDFNSLDRIDKVAETLHDDKRPRILIDHHMFPEPVADHMFSDTSASSTCEMIYDFLEQIDQTHYVNKAIGDCLYTGIITDTGGFKYATSPKLFRTVAKLLEAGADDYKVQDQIWNSMSEKQLRLLGHCLANRMEAIPEYRTAIIHLTKEDYAQFDIQRGDTEGIVNYLLRMPNVVIAAFIHEQPTIVKISLRSKGTMNVQQICKDHFRGGGHMNASGGASFAPLRGTIKKFKQLLPTYTDQINAAYEEFKLR
ncbi:MAG: DHH family phosphoesterase, partial [Bacteroidota bacterium]